MFEAYRGTAEFRLILAIAETWREEFGAGIDAQPGGIGTEAGQINRAFQETAWCILRGIAPCEADLPALVTWVLMQAARQRLETAGIPISVVENLVGSEPARGDAWYAYLALAPETVIQDLLGNTQTDGV